jgi:hypothetical protein
MAPKGPLRTVRKRLLDANWTLFFWSYLVTARQAPIHGVWAAAAVCCSE